MPPLERLSPKRRKLFARFRFAKLNVYVRLERGTQELSARGMESIREPEKQGVIESEDAGEREKEREGGRKCQRESEGQKDRARETQADRQPARKSALASDSARTIGTCFHSCSLNHHSANLTPLLSAHPYPVHVPVHPRCRKNILLNTFFAPHGA